MITVLHRCWCCKGTARDVFVRLMDGVDPVLVERGEDALAGSAGVDAVSRLRVSKT